MNLTGQKREAGEKLLKRRKRTTTNTLGAPESPNTKPC